MYYNSKRSGRWIPLCLIITLVACLSGSGCGSREKTENGRTYRIGFLASEFSNVFMSTMQQSFIDHAEELGFTVYTEASSRDAEQQVNQLLSLISQKIDALVYRPNSMETAKPVIQTAAQYNIPLFLMDTTGTGEESAPLIQTDNTLIGVLAARELGERILARHPEGGQAAIISGYSYLSSHMDRTRGFKETLAREYPSVKLVAEGGFGREEEVRNIVEDWLAQYGKELHGIYCISDYLAEAILEAARAMGMSADTDDPSALVLISTDGNPNVIRLIREGHMAGTVSQNAVRIGTMTADVVYRSLVEKEDVPLVNYVPSMVITVENVDSPEVKEFGIWADTIQEEP